MKVLTRTLVVVLTVPLLLALSARFVSHPSAEPAPATTTTTVLKLPPTSTLGATRCLKWVRDHCVEDELSIGSGIGSSGGSVSFWISASPDNKHRH